MKQFSWLLLVLTITFARSAQAQTETVLYNFCSQPNCSDGDEPQSNLIFDGAGNLYGTTGSGDGPGYGNVFELSPNGNGGWSETVLHSFTGGADGGTPLYSPVIFDGTGNLYGTTSGGGQYGNGVVFELSPVGKSWTETVLYNFCSQPGCSDGSNPQYGLIFDASGNLYGTTCNCGNGENGKGVVFELSPSGGGWTERVIYNLDGQAESGVTMDAGNIFGTSFSTVFELSPNGNGGWTPTVISTFAENSPTGTPVLDQAGNIYVATESSVGRNAGNVYKLSPEKNGKWTKKILFRFGGQRGSVPSGGLVLDAAGNLYGTTEYGGYHGQDGGFGNGTVFELVPPNYKETVLWNFNNGGTHPNSGLILDVGKLYGTTTIGGLYGWGVVFEVTP
jgi:uncharacterized repeat protein (TIGR03803 family)